MHCMFIKNDQSILIRVTFELYGYLQGCPCDVNSAFKNVTCQVNA